MNTVDTTPDPDLDNIVAITIGIAEKIREDDPRRLYDELASLAHWHPAKAAQVIMTFAAWFDPEESTKVLRQRTNEVIRAQCDRITNKSELVA